MTPGPRRAGRRGGRPGRPAGAPPGRPAAAPGSAPAAAPPRGSRTSPAPLWPPSCPGGSGAHPGRTSRPAPAARRRRRHRRARGVRTGRKSQSRKRVGMVVRGGCASRRWESARGSPSLRKCSARAAWVGRWSPRAQGALEPADALVGAAHPQRHHPRLVPRPGVVGVAGDDPDQLVEPGEVCAAPPGAGRAGRPRRACSGRAGPGSAGAAPRGRRGPAERRAPASAGAGRVALFKRRLAAQEQRAAPGRGLSPAPAPAAARRPRAAPGRSDSRPGRASASSSSGDRARTCSKCSAAWPAGAPHEQRPQRQPHVAVLRGVLQGPSVVGQGLVEVAQRSKMLAAPQPRPRVVRLARTAHRSHASRTSRRRSRSR